MSPFFLFIYLDAPGSLVAESFVVITKRGNWWRPENWSHIPHLIPVMVVYFSGLKNERDKRY